MVLHLLQPGPASQEELATAARVSAQTMSRTLERLERDGFVTRSTHDVDRRRSAVVHTAAGAGAFARARSLEDDVFPAVDDPDQLRRLLLQVLHRGVRDRPEGARGRAVTPAVGAGLRARRAR